MKGYFSKLADSINELAGKELERANTENSKFNSLHQAYGVMKEELEEAGDELELAKEELENFWTGAKEDFLDDDAAEKIKMRAVLCAAECVQLAAMAQKTLDSLEY